MKEIWACLDFVIFLILYLAVLAMCVWTWRPRQ